MPLVHMSDMLRHAYQNKYAVGAFDVVNLDFISGLIAAAKQKQASIISLAESYFDYVDFELLLTAVPRAAVHPCIDGHPIGSWRIPEIGRAGCQPRLHRGDGRCLQPPIG